MIVFVRLRRVSKIMMTMNARSLHNFFKHRCCNRAQWDSRNVDEQMLIEVCKVAPELFSKAGPACASGPCCEGKMTCGRASEIKELFSNM